MPVMHGMCSAAPLLSVLSGETEAQSCTGPLSRGWNWSEEGLTSQLLQKISQRSLFPPLHPLGGH